MSFHLLRFIFNLDTVRGASVLRRTSRRVETPWLATALRVACS